VSSVADPVRASALLERALRRDRQLTVAFLLLVWLLGCAYLLTGAGMGGPMAMMSHHPESSLHAAYLLVAMWWAMMLAMMVPSAAPTILLFCAVHRQGQAGGTLRGSPPVAAFALGYLGVWFAFSLAASALQWELSRSTIFSPESMIIRPKWLVVALLLLASAYQLSPMKRACLTHCRSPASFLAAHWRPGAIGAARLGLLHGGYCLGCCWAMMLLLFAGGVMNIVWIVLLSTLVLAERLVPAGYAVRRLIGLVLLVMSGVVLLS
jgi:predicted metal-binding membrane protein